MEFFDPLNTETDRYPALFNHGFDSMSLYEEKIGIRGFHKVDYFANSLRLHCFTAEVSHCQQPQGRLYFEYLIARFTACRAVFIKNLAFEISLPYTFLE